jgi:hypothetical protein
MVGQLFIFNETSKGFGTAFVVRMANFKNAAAKVAGHDAAYFEDDSLANIAENKLFVMTTATNVLTRPEDGSDESQRNFVSGLALILGKEQMRREDIENAQAPFVLNLLADEDHVLIPESFNYFADNGDDIALIKVPESEMQSLEEFLAQTKDLPKMNDEAKEKFKDLEGKEYSGIKEADWDQTFKNRE